MMSAYESGDFYLAFAKQARAVPDWATKDSHEAERDQFQQCALGVQYGIGEDSLALRINQPPLMARHLLRLHREVYRQYWKWSDGAVDHTLLRGSQATVFGWTHHLTQEPKERSIRNFFMQANGAEILRLACCLGTENGIFICAPVHDAVLMMAPLYRLEADIASMRGYMQQASGIVLAYHEQLALATSSRNALLAVLAELNHLRYRNLDKDAPVELSNVVLRSVGFHASDKARAKLSRAGRSSILRTAIRAGGFPIEATGQTTRRNGGWILTRMTPRLPFRWERALQPPVRSVAVLHDAGIRTMGAPSFPKVRRSNARRWRGPTWKTLAVTRFSKSGTSRPGWFSASRSRRTKPCPPPLSGGPVRGVTWPVTARAPMARFAALSAPEGSAPHTPGPTRQEGECSADGGSNRTVACQLQSPIPRLSDQLHADPDAPARELVPTGADGGLQLYSEMRLAVQRCAEIDEAAGLKDQAQRLEAYARIRDDKTTEARFAEIRRRAIQRIGELSRELETAQGLRTELPDTDGRKLTKTETLEQSGMNERTARRYEALAGPKGAEKTTAGAVELYFGQMQAAGDVPTLKGLTEAVTATRLKKKRVKPAEASDVARDASLNLSVWLSAVERVTADPVSAAEGQISTLVLRNLEWCDRAFALLQAFKKRTQELYPDAEAEK